MKFKYLDHTSEAKFQAFGDELAECFANAALAVTGLMTKLEEVKPKKKRNIRIESNSRESLLYDLLDEIIYVVDVEGLFISKFEDAEIRNEGEKLIFSGTAFGDSVENCPQGGDVKAPTYDEMRIEETEGVWMIQAVVDI